MDKNRKYERLIKEAKEFMTLAEKEYAAGKERKEDKKIRQGAEKAWNAAVQATKALAVKMGKKIPRNYNAQFQFLRALEKERPDIANGFPFTLAFQAFAKSLHGECFYHGEYVLDELDHNFEMVERYIELIEKI